MGLLVAPRVRASRRFDLCFELAQLITDRLRAHGRVVDELHGFRSFDERDLLGFVDGTENPDWPVAPAAVLIGEDDPQFAGGSYAVAQKYLHDLEGWNALTVEEQERVIGGRKLNDVELGDEEKPADSHVALNMIVDEQGEQQQIMRFNMPFRPRRRGGVRHLLRRLRPPSRRARADAREHVPRLAAGHHRPDPRLLHRGHRQPVLVPTVDFLDDPSARAPAASDGSLAIGSLKGR